MRATRRIAGHVAAALIGAVTGGTIVLAIDGATRDLPRQTRPDAVVTPFAAAPEPAQTPAPAGKVLLAWSPGGLPAATERSLEKLRGVRDATTVRAGLEWIELSRADGSIVDRPSGGRAIPFEVAVIEPREYARYVPPGERDAVLTLKPGEALLAESAAEIRGAGRGLSLRLRGGPVEVTDVVSDVATQGYEALLVGDIARTWARVDRFVLIQITNRADRHAIQRTIGSFLAPDQRLRIRAQGEVPFLRYGDAVLPQMVIKHHFGEFAAAPNPDGSIDIDPRWRQRNIVAANVPILGRVTCHRALLPQLRGAMNALLGEGLGFTVDPSEFAGCHSARFIDANPGGRLSHHSWGIAFDINVASNAPGTRPDQDPRLVEIMEEHGFTWGGRWLIPDGMHFEWVRFP